MPIVETHTPTMEPPKTVMVVDGETMLKIADLQTTVNYLAPAVLLAALACYFLMQRVFDLEERVGKLELP
jgi:hypothetical protein